MKPNFILPEGTRYDKLKGWLHGRGLTIGKVAAAAGLNPDTCRWSLMRDYADQARVDLFLALGIPEDLLPKPWRVKPRGSK